MYNVELLQSSVSKITKELIQQAVFLAYRDGITSKAPLGSAGDSVLLLGSASPRSSYISIRNYCGDAELLITDTEGHFLFYGRFRIDLGLDFVVDQYWSIFKKVKSKITTNVERVSIFKDVTLNKNVEYTEGFEILKMYQLLKFNR